MQLPDKYEPSFLKDLDKRTQVFQSLNTAYQEVMNDMGGQDGLSHVQICLAERFCFLEHVLHGIELQIAENPKQSAPLLSRWIQGLNAISGLGKTIGIERRARQITSLEHYIKQKKG